MELPATELPIEMQARAWLSAVTETFIESGQFDDWHKTLEDHNIFFADRFARIEKRFRSAMRDVQQALDELGDGTNKRSCHRLEVAWSAARAAEKQLQSFSNELLTIYPDRRH